MTQGGHISTEPRINERIRVPEVRLVGPAGEQVGIVAINDALLLAQEADLDLVEVAPTARPPVCKLMDYGKFKYESALKARESRKNQAQTVIKEIKLRPKIDPHDYGTKKGHVERFLKAGDKVKVTIMFRGREQSRPELGYRLLQRLAADVEELGFVEAQPKLDGRNMIMVIGPHKRKTGPQHEPRTERVPARVSARAARDSGASADSEHEPAAAPAAASAQARLYGPRPRTPEPVRRPRPRRRRRRSRRRAVPPGAGFAPQGPAAAPSRPAPAPRPAAPSAPAVGAAPAAAVRGPAPVGAQARAAGPAPGSGRAAPGTRAVRAAPGRPAARGPAARPRRPRARRPPPTAAPTPSRGANDTGFLARTAGAAEAGRAQRPAGHIGAHGMRTTRAPGTQKNGDNGEMPKMKTHSGSNKRFRVTGTGKIMRRRANRNHLLEHKPSTRTRRLKQRGHPLARRPRRR